MKLPSSFYIQENTISLSTHLLGKVLCTNIGGHLCSGIICETEAYLGKNDKASHAYGGKRSKRTETMYALGGISYVYLCYGIHHLFNVVTGTFNNPQAILIRGTIPLDGKTEQLNRRKIKKENKNSFIGPAKVSQALNIDLNHNGSSLQGEKIWIEDRKIEVVGSKIISGPRIGIDYAEEDASLPYRFQYNSFQV